MITLTQMMTRFPDEDACREHLFRLRWPAGKPRCARCASEKVYKTANRWRWKCKQCDRGGYTFSLTSGTIFENTKYPLRTWFQCLFLMLQSKKGMSALQIQRTLGSSLSKGLGSYETFWYMCTRLRAAMKNDEFRKLTGIIELDETYVGGKDANRHRNKRVGHRGGGPGLFHGGKAGVIGAISRKGNVTAKVIERLNVGTVSRFVSETISPAVTLVATDQAPGYDRIAWGPLRSHQSVDHSKGEYVRGVVHTANLDAFWSLLKRGVVGTYHNVSKKYLPFYVNEFAFRHNHRHNPDVFDAVLSSC